MNKIKGYFKNNKWLFITFFISSIIISIIYIYNKIAPFGPNSMLCVDFYHQYGPLLNELVDRVKNGSGLLYSFNTGLGIPFFRNYLNYLSSLFNIIIFMFKKSDIVMSYSIVIAAKVIGSSVTMAYYLKNTFKKENIFICIFALLYAFSGYFCAYYWNIMWLDGMFYLPIIMYGINKLVDDNKPVLYIISLAIMLFSNYFIGYMICIFSVLYFIGYIFYKGNYNIKYLLKKCVMFAISSVLSAGLVSFALIPLYYSLSSISATHTGTFPLYKLNFGISNYLFNHIPFVDRTVFASDPLPMPNVYCGILTLVLVLMLFFNKKINIKFKIISLSALIFFFLSFNINVIDYVWHAFHVPNDLPYRYSFIYVFTLTTIGYYSMIKAKDLSYLKTTISFMIVFVFVMLASKLGFKNIDNNRIIVCLIILTLYYLLYLFSSIKQIPKKILKIVFIIICAFECTFGICINWDISHDIDTFMSDKDEITNIIAGIKSSDNDLYRMEKTDSLTLNDPAWYNYTGVSTFTSMAYESVAATQRKFGMPGNDINSYYYKKTQTPIYNTIFDVKYLIGDYINDDYYNNIKTGNYYVNEYLYPSSFVYAVNKNIKNMELYDYMPFINQSNFVVYSTELDNVLIPLDVTCIQDGVSSYNSFSNGEFFYNFTEDTNQIIVNVKTILNKPLYLYVKGNVSGYQVDSNYYSITSDEYYTIDVGKFDKESVDVKIDLLDEKEGSLVVYAYTLNEDVFENFYNKINDNSLKVNKYSDTLIEGKIKADNNQIAFSSIAYDKGFNVFVDGKKVKTYKVLEGYLGFDISKGTHNIKISYYPYKMREGLLVSLVSFVVISTYELCRLIKQNKKTKKR